MSTSSGQAVAVVIGSLFACIVSATSLFAQSDSELVAAARAAMRNQDCASAVVLLERVEQRTRTQPLWLYTAAQAYECHEDFSEALRLYRAYDATTPGSVEILEKIDQMLYAQQEDVRHRAEEERERAEQEHRRRALERQRTVLSGTWEGAGYVLRIVQHSDGFISARSMRSSMNPRLGVDDTVFTGRLANDEIIGTFYARFRRSLIERCPALAGHHFVDLRLRVEDDGMTLRGDSDGITAHASDCSIDRGGGQSRTFYRVVQ
jgi:hypothetical protein